LSIVIITILKNSTFYSYQIAYSTKSNFASSIFVILRLNLFLHTPNLLIFSFNVVFFTPNCKSILCDFSLLNITQSIDNIFNTILGGIIYVYSKFIENVFIKIL